jgi:hypothetical protein
VYLLASIAPQKNLLAVFQILRVQPKFQGKIIYAVIFGKQRGPVLGRNGKRAACYAMLQLGAGE